MKMYWLQTLKFSFYPFLGFPKCSKTSAIFVDREIALFPKRGLRPPRPTLSRSPAGGRVAVLPLGTHTYMLHTYVCDGPSHAHG